MPGLARDMRHESAGQAATICVKLKLEPSDQIFEKRITSSLCDPIFLRFQMPNPRNQRFRYFKGTAITEPMIKMATLRLCRCAECGADLVERHEGVPQIDGEQSPASSEVLCQWRLGRHVAVRSVGD